MNNIRIENLTKMFGELTAVDNVNMSVSEGEVLCLLGPSGCGKTTTLRMIAGLEQQTSGDIFISDANVNELRPSERDIAMVFQFYALYPTLTVGENISFPLRSERLDKSEVERRLSEVARALQLDEVINRLPGQLGEGEKQRVAVARAVIRNPNCFLFDEPLSRLDVTLRQTMRGEIKEILSGLSKPSIIVTHDQFEALTLADRIAVMRQGKIEQIATPHEIFAKPANKFVAGFIGTPAMNLVSGELISRNDKGATFKICDQQVLVENAPEKISSGDALTIGIRPRSFVVASEKSEQTMSARVDLIEPMGAETLIHARAGDTDIRVVVDRSMKPKTDEQIFVQCKPGQVHVFDEQERLVAQ